MKNWFYKLKELEDSAGELYLDICKMIEKDHPEISEVFFNLYEDEIGHGRQIDFAKGLYVESESIFNENSENLGRIESSLSFIKNISDIVKSDKNNLTPLDYLKFALELEEQFAEGHLLLSFDIEDENIKKLLESMISEDRVHIKRIKRTIDRFSENQEKNLSEHPQ